ncbi:YcaO-like family protein [Thermomonospora umbrina]|uniref:Ribosomal protein S12 methylthiotransferase accessory factor n=1 Tax=Thermomonospora umbrina TaxID=111806 RepID=A0A3D9SYL9_9ACTN|nr:YcaO-like family protein [Thermomonospora umbrina]REF01050.1 ribosomal protein S12 methylthiotransferase accessory factor [Thermomonospora umbrina]
MNPEALVDPRTGVITQIVHADPEPWWPRGLDVCATHVADIASLLPWPADRVSTGTAFGDPGRARLSAIGEAVERYCGNFVPAGLRRATHAELVGAGEHAVDPADLALYSPAQYADPGCPFTPFTADLPVLWTRGASLPSEEPVWVPASLVYINYHQPPRLAEPVTNYVMLAGIAAGTDDRMARTAALEEVIERDATVIWWANRLPARPVHVDHPRLASVLTPSPELGPGWARAVGARGPCRYRVVALPTVFDVAVVGVLLEDPEHELAVFGVAARPDPAVAVHKALAEAVTLRRYAMGLLDPDGDIWTAAREGTIPIEFFRPYRDDRRYADSYRADFRDVADLSCHSQIWLDPSLRPHLEPIIGDHRPIGLDELPSPAGDPYDIYLGRLAAAGLTAHAVDVTTPDAAAVGFRAARVVVPGAYSNAPAAFPFLGGARLRTDPVRLGLRDAPLAEEDVNLVPLPHT